MGRFLLFSLSLFLGGRLACAGNPTAFLPFRDVLSEKDLEPEGFALAQYLERDVRLIREVPNVVDVSAATEAIRSLSTARRDAVSPIELKLLARRLRASEVFWGTYGFRDGRRTIGILHYLADTDAVTSSERTSIDKSEFAIVDELVLNLAGKSLWRIPEGAEKTLSARETDSFRAYTETLAGNDEISKGVWRKAILHYNQAIEIDPSYSACLVLRGNCRFKSGDLAAAKEDYETAAMKNPRDWVPRNNLGVACRKEGNVRLAIKQYGEGLKNSPDSLLLRFNRGNAFSLLNSDTETKDDYETCLKLKPDFAPALYQLGLFYARRGGDSQAREFWERAHRSDPSLIEECFKNRIPIDDILAWPSCTGRMEPKYEYGKKPLR